MVRQVVNFVPSGKSTRKSSTSQISLCAAQIACTFPRNMYPNNCLSAEEKKSLDAPLQALLASLKHHVGQEKPLSVSRWTAGPEK